MATIGRVGRPLDGDSAATRRSILRAARERFARDGFRSTTNRLIAHDVGITSAAIYHYFDSKAALYAAVYCSTIDEVYTSFEQVAAPAENLIDAFAAVLCRAGEMHLADPSITGFIVAVSFETQRHPDLLVLIEPQRARHTRFFAELVAAAERRGELAVDIDRRALADLLGSILSGIARTAATSGDGSRYAAAVNVMQRLLTGSLVAR